MQLLGFQYMLYKLFVTLTLHRLSKLQNMHIGRVVDAKCFWLSFREPTHTTQIESQGRHIKFVCEI